MDTSPNTNVATFARASVEAGIAMSWRDLIGDAGRAVSLEHFGESADYQRLCHEFGITARAVTTAAQDSLTAAGQTAAAGANPQRPLWASTGVKDPSLPDTLHVTGLVAPHTVNTMPEKTPEAAFETSWAELLATVRTALDNSRRSPSSSRAVPPARHSTTHGRGVPAP